ncbi:MAG: hypothetical protein AB7Q29_05705 [Vicinamibacterales bacterium]
MDTLVTCMYNGLWGTPYGGRLNRDAMYRDSLRTIARTGLRIVCFVPAADVAAQQTHFQTSAADIIFVPLELHDVPHHAAIQRIKARDAEEYSGIAWQERCVEVMWGKFFMLDRVLEAAPDAERMYWIDAGLANANVISTKYIAEADLHNGRLSEVASAFTPKLFARIRDFAGDRVLAIKTTQAHHPGIPAKYNRAPYTTSDGVIAGLFGGHRARVAELTALFHEKVEATLRDERLFFEESILTAIYSDRPELFQTFTFDSWYHEGWNVYNPAVVNFSQFFDLMLETPPSRRILEFPWNAA